MVTKKVVKKKSTNTVKKMLDKDLKMVKRAIKQDAKTIKKIVKKKVKMNSKRALKSEIFICYNCGNEIEEFDKQVWVETANNGHIIDDIGFHWGCWIEYFNNAVTKKAKENVAQVQKKVMGLMDNPIVKSLLSNIKGVDGIIGMLQTPLSTDVVNQVQEKIQDDRKRETKSRKRATKT